MVHRFAASVLVLSLTASSSFAQDKKAPQDTGTKSSNAFVRIVPESVPECVEAQKKFQAGDLNECMKLLEAASAKHPELPPAQIMFAVALISAKQAAAGRALMERAAIDKADHPEVYRHFGELAFSEGRYTDAAVQFEKAIAKANSERWSLSQRRVFLYNAHAGMAAVAERRGDWKSAHTNLYILRSIEPDNARIRWRLGRSLFFQNQLEDAVTELRQASGQDKTLEPAELTMGGLWHQKRGGKPEETKENNAKAEHWIRQALSLYPKDIRVQVSAAQFYLDLGRLDEAKTAAEEAVRIDPKHFAARLLLAIIARSQKNFPVAEKILQELVAQSPSDFGATNQLALVLAEQEGEEKLRKAQELAAVNAKLFPNGVEAITTLGWIQFRVGALDDAERNLTAAVRTGQGSSDSAYYLASVMVKKGKTPDDAKKLLRAALDAPGVFVHRTDCAALLKSLEETKTTPKKP